MQKTPSFTIQCWGLFFWISKKWKSSFLFFCQQGFELCSPKFVNLWNSSFMSQISSLMLLMMIAIMMIMIIMMVMLIMITIKIINVEHIWLISLDAMWIKISFAVACDFNHLVYTVYIPHPSLDYTLTDYSHSDHRRLDCTQLDYTRLDYTFGLSPDYKYVLTIPIVLTKTFGLHPKETTMLFANKTLSWIKDQIFW